ncbi:MAG: polysaccharide deacetylase family protein [Planctomycetota bacterium]|jgi:peptidoglycan/xylan/chitin deacetylase (PgdA/CDA1 family)
MAHRGSSSPTAGHYATDHRQLLRRSFRGTLRHATLSAAAAASRLSGHRRAALCRPRVQVFLLHHLFDSEVAGFRSLLRSLAAHHRFVSYSEAVRRIDSGSIDAPCVSFTFDDGLQNVLAAARLLREFDAFGCFFVCPSMIGVTDHDAVAAFCRQRLQIPPVPLLDWDQIESLRDEGHEIGSHTMGHVNLGRAEPEQVREEIGRAHDALTARLGSAPHFAWPYGSFNDFSADAARLVFEAGHVSCASGVRGAHGPGATRGGEPPCVRRDHLVAAWPVGHALVFAARNSDRLSKDDGAWPPGWTIQVGS